MKKSRTLHEADAKAIEIDKKLTAYDFAPNRCVQVMDDEGCQWFYRSAFALKWHEWYFVFAEHHVKLVIHEDEVTWIAEYTMIDKEIKNADKFKPTRRRMG